MTDMTEEECFMVSVGIVMVFLFFISTIVLLGQPVEVSLKMDVDGHGIMEHRNYSIWRDNSFNASLDYSMDVDEIRIKIPSYLVLNIMNRLDGE
jgi:hypothetical protein